jgi:hypothetical protein
MRTYVLDVDGKPALAFRAESEAAAAKVIAAGSVFLNRPEGTLTVRPATIFERYKWQRASIEDVDADDDADEDECDPEEWNPDSVVVPLDEEK